MYAVLTGEILKSSIIFHMSYAIIPPSNKATNIPEYRVLKNKFICNNQHQQQLFLQVNSTVSSGIYKKRRRMRLTINFEISEMTTNARQTTVTHLRLLMDFSRKKNKFKDS